MSSHVITTISKTQQIKFGVFLIDGSTLARYKILAFLYFLTKKPTDREIIKWKRFISQMDITNSNHFGNIIFPLCQNLSMLLWLACLSGLSITIHINRYLRLTVRWRNSLLGFKFAIVLILVVWPEVSIKNGRYLDGFLNTSLLLFK